MLGDTDYWTRDSSRSLSTARSRPAPDSLQDIHGDPADRLIVATALEGHRLVTADRGILAWPGRLSRLPATD